ncbi:MAG: EAL domain-containing protein [Lysobacteraceae bacterium]
MAFPSPDVAQPPVATRPDDPADLHRLRAEAERLCAQGRPQQALTLTLEALAATLRQLGDARQYWEHLINAIPDAVTVFAADGRIVEANRAASREFGCAREALLGLSVYDLNPELPANRIRQVIVEHGDGESFVHLTRNRRSDGSEFPVEVHSCVVTREGQSQVLAVARDISHRLESERELRASANSYRQLLLAMDKGVLIHDAQGRLVSYNPSACRISRMSGDELVETLAHDDRWTLIDAHGNPITEQDTPHRRALRERRTIASSTVGVYLKEQARHVWLDVTATPQFREGEETPFQVISTFSDISALIRDRELFRQTQTLARIGGWDWTPSHDALYVTDTLLGLFDLPGGVRYRLSDLLARIDEAQRLRVEAAFQDAAAQGAGFDIECRLTRGCPWIRLIGSGRHRDGQAFRVTGTAQDISEQKQTAERLTRQALSDPLTGLHNRDALLARIGEALDACRRDSPPSLLHVDLDRFKVVNDLLGHPSGDRLLRLAGERLRGSLRDDAIAGRLGADEFLVLVPHGGHERARQLAERIIADFVRPFSLDREDLTVTASLGIASYPDAGTTVQQLLQSADVAVREAKRRGRGGWKTFDPALAATVSRQLLLETQLRRALEQDELSLVYQPQVDLGSGRLRAVEALLRWRNRLLGEVSPNDFIPHAENTGDIVRIGNWVVREACRQFARWQRDGVAIERVAVNVSPRQLLNEDFDAIVGMALEESGLPGQALEVEITERVVIDEAPEALRTLRALKARGVTITIDDFGEGYSALSYLRRLPLDNLKISHTFIRGIPDNPADVAICRSILLIARSLGLQVIGEGVESDQQRRFLIEHGTDLAQGFLYAQPLDADGIADYRAPD